MSSIALSGNDTLIIQDRILSDLADGDVGVLAFEGEVATVKTGKNGNAIYSLNENGKVASMTLRLIRGSADDRWLNGLFAQQQLDFAGFTLLNGQLIKKIGDGVGNIKSDTYILQGGVFTKSVDAKSNVEGDSEQSVSIYTIKFSGAPRAIS